MENKIGHDLLSKSNLELNLPHAFLSTASWSPFQACVWLPPVIFDYTDSLTVQHVINNNNVININNLITLIAHTIVD